MHLHVKSRSGGEIVLLVTRPDGLTRDESPSNDFVVKLITPQAAREVYAGMHVYNAEKVAHLVQHLPSGWINEMAFLQPNDRGVLVCKNDAHVLEALALLGVDPVPVVMHYRHASLI